MEDRSTDPEPTVNISGGTTGGGATFDGDEPAASTRAARIVAELGDLYWRKTYGGQDAFRCLVRTILSQNTSDVASQPAFETLIDAYEQASDLARILATADVDRVAGCIESAGLYNRKARTIVDVAQWVLDRFGSANAFDSYVTSEPAAEVRSTLLEVRGIGPKTADCVLLFAGGQDGVFPVDTHVHRIYRRIGVAPPDADHETVRDRLESAVPAAMCGFGHTASIQFGREYCTARSPVCLEDESACPLASRCDQIGVDPEGGTVVNPTETTD